MSNVVKFNEKQDQNTTVTQYNTSGGVPTTISANPIQNFNNQQAVKPQQNNSSGQFTNIQKYLNANKSAGQQVANAANRQLDRNIRPDTIQRDEATDKIRENVQKANNSLNEGNATLGVLSQDRTTAKGVMSQRAKSYATPPQSNDTSTVNTQVEMGEYYTPPNPITEVTPVSTPSPKFNALDYISNQDNLKKVIDYRLGNTINEDELKNQSTTAQTSADYAKSKADEQFKTTKTEAGRGTLLAQSFKSPGSYSTGQKALDSLFLSGAGKQGIAAIRDKAKNILADTTKTASDLSNEIKTNVTGDTGVINREAALSKSMQDKTNELENSYVKDLENQLSAVNKRREAEVQGAKSFFDQLTGKTSQANPLDSTLFDMQKLIEGDVSYNVLENPNLTAEGIFNFSKQKAEKAQDAATIDDANYYRALAALSKGTLDDKGRIVGPREDQLTIRGASQLEDAVTAGPNNLRKRFDEARTSFINNARGTSLEGVGVEKGGSTIFGSGGDASARYGVNMGDYLGFNSNEFKASEELYNNPDIKGSELTDAAIAAAADTNPITAAVYAIDQALGGGLSSGISSLIASMSGANSGSPWAAQQWARRELNDQINSYLKNRGIGNLITKKGRVNVNNELDVINTANKDISDKEVTGRQHDVAGLKDRYDKYNALASGKIGQSNIEDLINLTSDDMVGSSTKDLMRRYVNNDTSLTQEDRERAYQGIVESREVMKGLANSQIQQAKDYKASIGQSQNDIRDAYERIRNLIGGKKYVLPSLDKAIDTGGLELKSTSLDRIKGK